MVFSDFPCSLSPFLAACNCSPHTLNPFLKFLLPSRTVLFHHQAPPSIALLRSLGVLDALLRASSSGKNQYGRPTSQAILTSPPPSLLLQYLRAPLHLPPPESHKTIHYTRYTANLENYSASKMLWRHLYINYAEDAAQMRKTCKEWPTASCHSRYWSYCVSLLNIEGTECIYNGWQFVVRIIVKAGATGL